VHWPQVVGSRDYHEPVSSLDLAATFLAAAGAEPLATQDGVDLVPCFGGALTAHERLFWRRAVTAAVRDGDWKLIRVQEADGSYRSPILVDLETDPGELTDRSRSEPERVAHLTALLEAWERTLLPPRWLTGEVWRKNQRNKHAMDIVGREAERKLP
jgi:arylsulfatase A-like enzyme